MLSELWLSSGSLGSFLAGSIVKLQELAIVNCEDLCLLSGALSLEGLLFFDNFLLIRFEIF